MSYETLLWHVDGAVAELTLNRPDAANSIDSTMGRELLDAAIRCDRAT